MLELDGIIYSLQSGGGISVYFSELVKRAKEKDIAFNLSIFEHNNFPNIDQYSVSISKGRFLERYRDAICPKGFDLFHSSYYRLPQDKRKKIVTTVHDFTYERHVGGIRNFIHSNQKRRAVSLSDKIICISENTKNDLLEFYGNKYESIIEVIPNGVSDDYMPLNLSIEPTQILYVGSRAAYKNFSLVARAVSHIDNISLLCVGGGELSPHERNQLEEMLPSRYKHVKYLTNSELNVEYNRSICLAYPSSYEGFGIPILEAMRAGCPVIAVNASSIPEVAGDACYLLDYADVESIRNAIHYMLSSSNRELHAVMGFQQAQKFSWNTTFEKTIKVYEEVLGCKY